MEMRAHRARARRPRSGAGTSPVRISAARAAYAVSIPDWSDDCLRLLFPESAVAPQTSGEPSSQSMQERRMRRSPYAVFALVLTLTGAAGSLAVFADQPSIESREADKVVMQAREFESHGAYAKALQLLRPLADQGVATAQFVLGSAYGKGSGVPKDETQAVAWYRKAADQGNADAQNSLGVAYALGHGVAKDEAVALAWYRRAADQGDAEAQVNLGAMYYQGISVDRNEAQAVMWYRMAADQGDRNGQYNLGLAYDSGAGVPKDEAQAAAWYNKAASQGSSEAQFNLANDYESGSGVEKDERQAVAWYHKAADQGLAPAEFNLGNMYLKGSGVAKDEAQAVAWYRKAAESGLATAQYNLALAYDHGWGVAKDEAQAAAWYREAADQGYAEAQYNLGWHYAEGLGLSVDIAQAIIWYARAAQQSHAAATQNLEAILDRLPTLRVRSTADVRVRPEPNAPMLKSAVADEVGYVISKVNNWYEVYFRDGYTVGFVAASQVTPVVADQPRPRLASARRAAGYEPHLIDVFITYQMSSIRRLGMQSMPDAT